MITTFNNREVEIDRCYIKGVDSYVETAWYLDTGKELSDDELCELTDQSDVQDYLIQENIEQRGWFEK